MSLSREALFQVDGVAASLVTCSAPTGPAGPVEVADSDAVVFPVEGRFEKHLNRSHHILADPLTVVLFAEGRPHRVAHPAPGGDTCLSICLGSECLASLLADAVGVEGLGDPRLHPGAPLPLGTVAARMLLLHRVRRGDASPLECVTAAVALVGAALIATRSVPLPTRPPPLDSRDRVVAARDLLFEHPVEEWTLGRLEASVGLSRFHLTRLFRAHVGISPYEYVLRVRLLRTAEEVIDTRRSLTEIALDYGFSSHSHFTAAFRRRVGVPPSTLRPGKGASWSTIMTALMPMGSLH
ncbi:MAG TPA: helix-turn-helix transcriptional regulator [Rhodothermales bacterium]|nr:helix-turn-helix transcriptional regulator [Rhodothermales bacterium]